MPKISGEVCQTPFLREGGVWERDYPPVAPPATQVIWKEANAEEEVKGFNLDYSTIYSRCQKKLGITS